MRPLVFGIKRFVNYILASNGKISDDEAELLGEVLDRKIAPQELADYITAENVYSREYAQAIPASGSGSARKSFSRITPPEELLDITRGENFANAREVRNFFESAVVSQADRRYGKEGLSDEDLCRLEESDFKHKERMIE